MADKKISELDAITGANTAATDVFVVVDTSTGQTKKITREELNNAIEQDVLSTVDINGGTIDGTTIGGTTAAAGSFTTVDATGNITVGGTVDGRDVATDGTKLDGIEASATADQTGAEIATALNGQTISSLTALTTTGAVIVGGDLTVNGTTTTINSTTLTVDDKNIELASGAADAAAANGAGITIDGASATFNYASTGDKWTFNKPIDVTGNIIVSGTVDGRDVAADGTKLDGIETGATADQTKSDIDALGIDAATIDGIDSSQFLRSDADDTMTGDLLMDSANAEINIKSGVAGTTGRVNWTFDTTTTNYASLSLPYDTRATKGFHMDVGYPITIDATTQINFDIAGTNKATLNSSGNLALTGTSHTAGGNTIWHAGNDGSGSGLDADTLDGVQGSSFLRSDADDTVSADITFSDGNKAIFGDDADISIYHSGSANLIHSKSDLVIGKGVTGGSFKFILGQPSGAGGNTIELDSNSTGGHQRINAASTNYPLDIQYGGTTKISIDNTEIDINEDVKIDNGQTTTVKIISDDSGESVLNLYGNTQGTGRVFVGQSLTYGGGIEYNGDNSPTSTGAGADYITLFRRSNGVTSWTARNLHSSNDWEFRGNVTAYASDERLKENIETIPNALDMVCKLRGVTFDWKDDCEDKGFMPTMKHETGVIAQEVQAVIPDAAVPAPFDEEYLTVKHEKIIPVLIEAIKELKAEIEELKNASAE